MSSSRRFRHTKSFQPSFFGSGDSIPQGSIPEEGEPGPKQHFFANNVTKKQNFFNLFHFRPIRKLI